MTCAVRDSYVDWDFELSDPDSAANFVFRSSTSGQPVLVAVLLGTTTNWVALLDKELATMQPCDAAP